jgi:hypothetical protein
MKAMEFGNLFGKAAGRIIHAANADRKLKCPRCKKITHHTSYSNVDYVNDDESLDGFGKVALSAAMLTHDFTPGMPLIFGNLYMCCECEQVHHRGGVLSEAINKKNSCE